MVTLATIASVMIAALPATQAQHAQVAGRCGEPAFWDELYLTANGDNSGIRWNAQASHPLLHKHASLLTLAAAEPGATTAGVLVPLCGKSADLQYLRDKFGRAVGIEFSAHAARDFFKERQWHFEERPHGETVVELHGTGPAEGVSIFQGDLFSMTPEIFGGRFAAAYDRAAMVALPPDMLGRYASHLTSLLQPGAKVLLVTTEYSISEGDPPPFDLRESSVRAAYPDGQVVEFGSRALVKDGAKVAGVDAVNYAFSEADLKRMSYFSERVYAVEV